MTKIESHVPQGPITEKWSKHKADIKVVSPANKRKLDIIVVGTGLGGASVCLAGRTRLQCQDILHLRLAAQGALHRRAGRYRRCEELSERPTTPSSGSFTTPSRAATTVLVKRMSIVWRKFPTTSSTMRRTGRAVRRATTASCFANRSFGGAQVSRTFYARARRQQLLLGAYAALNRQIAKGSVKSYPRHEMLDLVLIDGKARGIITRNLVTGEIERFGAHAVVIATGGYGNVFFLSTNAMNSNGSAAWQCYKKGAMFANPCFAQIHPTCIPVHGEHQSKLTLMSESLRNDSDIWVPQKKEDVEKLAPRNSKRLPKSRRRNRDYYLERRYPAFGNLVPRDVASRAAKERCDAGFGVNETGLAVFLDFKTAIEGLGKDVIKARYGNLFQMYEKITDVDPYEEPMMIYPAVHYPWAASGWITT